MEMENVEVVQKIGEDRTLRVAVRSGGYYLYLPRDFVETYGVLGGDRLKVKILEHFRPTKPEEEADKENAHGSMS